MRLSEKNKIKKNMIHENRGTDIKTICEAMRMSNIKGRQ